jgi:hypothetical protein
MNRQDTDVRLLRDAKDCCRCATFIGREEAIDDRKGQWDQCATTNALQGTKRYQRLLRRGQCTQQRTNGKQSQRYQKGQL